MADLLLVFVGGVIVVSFVLNLAIWLKQRGAGETPLETPALFARTTRSFGGADFLGSAAVLAISLVIPFIVLVASMSARDSLGHINWRVAGPAVGVGLLLNWLTIHRRHRGLLDATWAGVAGTVILGGTCALCYAITQLA